MVIETTTEISMARSTFSFVYYRRRAVRIPASRLWIYAGHGEGGFVLDYRAPPGTSLKDTNELVKRVEGVLRATPEVLNVFALSECSSRRHYRGQSRPSSCA